MGIPRRIGNVQPFAELVRGKTTSLYRAFDVARDKVVVVKLLRHEWTHDAALVSRFRSEAAALQTVQHPNVIDILDLGEDAEGLYIITEYVEGASLRALFSERTIPVALGAFVVREAVRGLSAVHEQHALHRDVKPANILVSTHGEVKLADFGFSVFKQVLDANGSNEIMATLPYLAPELIRGATPTVASDLFSVGVTLFEVLTGHRPFRAETDSELMEEILTADPTVELDPGPAMSPQLVALCSSLLDRQPDNRPADCNTVVARLENALAEYAPEPSTVTLHQWLTTAAVFERPRWRPTGAAARRGKTTRPAEQPSARAAAGWKRVAWTVGLVAAPILAVLLLLRSTQTDAPTSELLTPAPSIPAATVHPSAFAAEDDSSDQRADFAAATSETDQAAQQVLDEPLALVTGSSDTVADTIRTAGEAELEPEPSDTLATFAQTTDSVDAAPQPPSFGHARLGVSPWATVFVDGERRGDTPLAVPLELEAGTHSFRLENPMFPPFEFERAILAGDTTDMAISLWDTVGQVRLSVSPWAVLTVDDQVRDTIPPLEAPLLVPAGSLRLLLHHPELGDWTHEMTVEAGSTYALRFNLYELLSK